MNAKTARIVGLGLGLAAGLGAALYHRFVRRPLPRLQGTVSLPGLSAPVEVLWDAWGVPHVYAQHTEDLFYVQGYLHAQDRLWQMDLNRRVGSGRLSEIFGERTLEADRFLRRVGLRSVAQEEAKLLEGEAANVQASYCSGVNAFMRAHQDRLPLEFSLLRYRPEPWTPVDALQWAKLMGWGLSLNWDFELFRAQGIASYGQELVESLERRYPPGHPVTVPPGGVEPPHAEADRTLWPPVAGILGGGMSNAWVVDGTRSLSGKPLLANDPHLFPQLPSAWYEMHLESPEVRITGASLPGAPGIVIGHNEHIAWGITASMVDTQDLYLEAFSEERSGSYQVENGWQDAEVVEERIRVRGRQEPAVERVLRTRHGPIISWSKTEPLRGYALRSTLLVPNQLSKVGVALTKARDWAEFRRAMADWAAPAVNMVYADADGNIGYQLVGNIPRRKTGTGFVPAPGWTEEYEWAGFLTQDEAPHVVNPSTHYILSANNKPGHDAPDAPITGEWMDGYRARRIQDLLLQKERVGREDVKAMQMDTLSVPAREVGRLLSQVELRSPSACWARDQLVQWDGRMTPESRSAALYQAFRHRLLRHMLAPLLGSNVESYLGSAVHPFSTTSTFPLRGTSLFLEWLEQLVAGKLPQTKGEAPEQLISHALEEAVEELGDRLGPTTARWSWGRLHQVTFRHPLGRGPLLGWFLNQGPQPLPGDGDTVHQAAFNLREPFEASRWLPSYRFIADTADWDQSLSVHAPGQSGQVGSRHYGDLLPLWLRGEYHPMPFSRQAVEALATSRQQFLP